MSVVDVDLKGLSDLIEDAGPERLLYELVRNALDEDGVRQVRMTLVPVPHRPLIRVTVEDDAPAGFRDLSHAYTLFAESYKKGNPEQAGRFNLGDKLFIAAAVLTGEPVTICSTKGTIVLRKSGRKTSRKATSRGTWIEGHLRVTHDRVAPICAAMNRLLVPPGIEYLVNGEPAAFRQPLREFEATLPTVVSDDQGVLRQSRRATMVEIYEPVDGHPATLYELGVPVVETGDGYDVNVLQKVPVNFNRDNVTPAYLRAIRTFVFNEMCPALSPEQATATWVREAMGDERATGEAIKTGLDLRFGEKRVIFDVGDPEANKNAVAAGFSVIHGRNLTKSEWENVLRHEGAVPAGRVFPTRKPYEGGPGSPPAEFLPESEWTPGMKHIAGYARWLHAAIVGRPLNIRVLSPSNRLMHFGACYAPCEMDFNLVKLGHKFFDHGVTDAVNELLIHEFAHYWSPDHLSDDYHQACCRLGARLCRLALDETREFNRRLLGPIG